MPEQFDYQVEALALDELAPPQRDQILAQLGAQADDLLHNLRQSNEDILARYPAGPQAEQIRLALQNVKERKDRDDTLSIRKYVYWLGPLATGLMLLLWLHPVEHVDTGGMPLPLEQTRLKGQASALQIFVRSGGGRTQKGHEIAPQAHAINDGDLAQAQDRLQIFLFPLSQAQETKSFAALISIDGAGQVSQIWPENGTEARPVQLQQGEEAMSLPFSYQLDAAPGFERFIVVRSERPFLLGPVIDAARSIAGHEEAQRQEIDLAPGLQQQSLLMIKASARGTASPQETGR